MPLHNVCTPKQNGTTRDVGLQSDDTCPNYCTG
jgi:hypothetical protein